METLVTPPASQGPPDDAGEYQSQPLVRSLTNEEEVFLQPFLNQNTKDMPASSTVCNAEREV